MIRDGQSLGLHRKLVEFIDSGRAFGLGVILRTVGSTPQKVGVKAILDGEGKIWGTLGGGAVEAEAQRRAPEVCRTGRAIAFDFDLAAADANAGGPICGGIMRVLIDPGAAKWRECYAQAAAALEARRRGVLLTRVREDGGQIEISTEWLAEKEVAAYADFPGGEAIGSCLKKEAARLFESEDGRSQVLVEPVIPRPVLLIVGGGHVGQALARLGVFNQFDVEVLEDRPEFATPELFGDGVRTRCGDIAKELGAFPFNRDCFIVIVTRGHQHDAEALRACIHAPAGYIGMIGSKRKVAMMREDFIGSGVATEEEWSRVFAPIGLEIGAVTVPEIATSIMAQVIGVWRNYELRITNYE